MEWNKYWLYYPLAILTLTAIIVITGIDDFLAKFRNRLTLSAVECHARGKRIYTERNNFHDFD